MKTLHLLATGQRLSTSRMGKVMNGIVPKAAICMILSLLVCGLALKFTAQAEIPKSGTVKFIHGCNSIGNVLQFSENHLVWAGSFKCGGHNTDGEFMRNHSWECYALNEIKDGIANQNGFCTVTDTDGDKIFVKYSANSKATDPVVGKGIFFAGTGKYKGIDGVNSFRCILIGEQAACTNELKYTLK